MDISDDEEDSAHCRVTNYYFLDDEEQPVSFSVLPVQWSEGENKDGEEKVIFLDGTADNGLQKIYKHVKAWRFDLCGVKPEISVLTKEDSWVKLQKPKKSYEDLIRTVLITVHSLSLLKSNPEMPGKSLWDNLSRAFSLYEPTPSQNDLIDHMDLISEAVKRDDSLAKSKFLLRFLEEKPKKNKLLDQVPSRDTSEFIVDDIDEGQTEDVEDDGSDDEDYFDTVCAICDNGGNILCCDGKCMRSFHAFKEAGEESLCESLGFSNKDVKEMQSFLCKNCQYDQHQCFACGKLGFSGKSSATEVFRCVAATCGYFYHPRCVAKLLHPGNKIDAEELEKSIAGGQSFTCPIHKCCVCKKIEDKKNEELQLAVCRRCPKSYHRKCLPREISFDDVEEEGIYTRAWDGLLLNRILIYCLDHKIDDSLLTPIRDHIKFPGIEENEKRAPELPVHKGTTGLKKRYLTSDDSSQGKTVLKAPKQLGSAKGEASEHEKFSSSRDTQRRMKVSNAPRKPMMKVMKTTVMDVNKSSATNEDKVSLGKRLYEFMNHGSDQAKIGRRDTADSKHGKNKILKPATKKLSIEPLSIDAGTERRLLALMKEAASSVTLEEIIQKHKVPSTHAHSLKHFVEKTTTLGRIEGSVEAVRAALQKIVKGNSIEDAKAVCDPEMLNQIFKWKDKLAVYLAPFLNGMRYTSFGRHFTKVEKLQEVVDKLHWYVQDGDMIVDFCCGANDFSCLMKEKLEETGKRCSYKNYDLFEAKNSFNFEQRDWFTVKKEELQPGSKLIIGLNPPFGVKAALANKFINRAIEFDPKLIVLIVPPETERLDQKKSSYRLVWEDNQSLSGKSFYLPGSIDQNDKQLEQWNLVAPPLSLWSRSDWVAKHKEIAQKHGHLFTPHVEDRSNEINVPAHAMSDCADLDNISAVIDDIAVQKDEKEETRQRVGTPKGNKENFRIDRSESMPKGDRKNSYLDRREEASKRDRENSCLDRREDTPTGDRENFRLDRSESISRGDKEKSGLDGHMASRKRKYGERYTKIDDNPCVGADPTLTEKYKGASRHSPFTSADEKSTLRGTSPNKHFESMDKLSADDFGRRRGENLEQEFTAHLGDDIGSLDRRPYNNVGREFNLPSPIPLCRQDPDVFTQRNHMSGHDPGYGHTGQRHDPRFSQMASMTSTSYEHLGSPLESSYRMNTSAMQRYAPQLDELNHTGMNSFGSGEPLVRNHGIYEPRGSQPASLLSSSSTMYDHRPPQPGSFVGNNGVHDPRYRLDSVEFTPRPPHPYPYPYPYPYPSCRSAGWLND
ncbi:LOW QUALITY PROTEIN: protein ENHANCED DOWNY MILDEW 2-like [Carica papaya]|uniref:LOW QUALITY PROTEIN: protein ENHANCED DOWNY MILDEW 2-like n=1 Tax=Carica papaya TaxID=3649 RepID=UPI000B8D0015|nr:LOW QUALITY PROTEIN: protein ENHANCED DOWNY MILDEW 2-like [Carica papaya]